MALSSQIINFVASPVLNDVQGFVTSEIESFLLTKAQRPVRSYLLYTPVGAKATSKIVFHVLTEAQHTFESSVTEYPVETGTNITDHVSHKNPSFSVRAMFSKASEAFLSNEKDGGVVSQEDAYKILTSIRLNKLPVTLRSPLDSYQDLIITNLAFPKTVSEGRSLFVDISFQQIRKVSTETTQVNITVKKENKVVAKGNATKDSAASKTNEGAKPPIVFGEDTANGQYNTKVDQNRIINHLVNAYEAAKGG